MSTQEPTGEDKHEQLERLKDPDEEVPELTEGTWEFVAAREHVATAHATLTVEEVKGDGPGYPLARGEFVLRIPFQDCGTPEGYVASVLKAFDLEAQPIGVYGGVTTPSGGA